MTDDKDFPIPPAPIEVRDFGAGAILVEAIGRRNVVLASLA